MQHDFLETPTTPLNLQIDYLDINMPLSKKDKEFLKKLIRQYGLKKGKSVFYAVEKLRKKKGVKKNKNTKSK